MFQKFLKEQKAVYLDNQRKKNKLTVSKMWGTIGAFSRASSFFLFALMSSVYFWCAASYHLF